MIKNKEITLPENAEIEFKMKRSTLTEAEMIIDINGKHFASATIPEGLTGTFSFGILKTPKCEGRFVFKPNINLSLIGNAIGLDV